MQKMARVEQKLGKNEEELKDVKKPGLYAKLKDTMSTGARKMKEKCVVM